MSQPPAPQTLLPVSPFSLFGNTPIAPNASTILGYKLLAETNPEAFRQLASNSTKWLATSLALLKKDPWLRTKLGPDLLQGSLVLAEALRANTEKVHMERRLKGVTQNMLNQELLDLGGQMDPLGDNDVIELNDTNGQQHFGQLEFQNRRLGASIFY